MLCSLWVMLFHNFSFQRPFVIVHCSPSFHWLFFFELTANYLFICWNQNLMFALARSLRPYPISGKRIVPDQIDKPDWADDVSYLSSSCLYALCLLWFNVFCLNTIGCYLLITQRRVHWLLNCFYSFCV